MAAVRSTPVTPNWNNGAGWMPIGDSSSSFSSFAAIFEGNSRTITNLFIDSSENEIGLFGVTRSSAVIRNLEMVSVQVTGSDYVGGLVGSNGGAVSACFATGKVSGDDDVGGLVGANLDDGSVSASLLHRAGDGRRPHRRPRRFQQRRGDRRIRDGTNRGGFRGRRVDRPEHR